MGINSLFAVDVYRNIYIKGYAKFPYQMLTGKNDLVYTGDIICNVETVPDEFDKERDLFIGCNCQYSKWRKLTKIKK